MSTVQPDISARLRVLLGDADIRKLTLPTGIPATVLELGKIVQETFQLQDAFVVQYMDSDFGDQFFSLTDTAHIKDKDTIKVVYLGPSIPVSVNVEPEPLDDACSSGSSTVILSSDESTSSHSPWSQRSGRWPSQFEIPRFAYDTELLLEASNEQHRKNGTQLNNPSVKSDILEKLAEGIFQYTAYPSNEQICQVAEALVRKHPCLKEPGSWTGMYGWQTSLKFKMANYRSKLRAIGCKEVEVNSVKRKAAEDRPSAKNIKKPRKAEVNYLPPRPIGETQETLEKERVQLLSEFQKRDNCVSEKMAKTFSYRREDVVQALSVKALKERWPALFDPTQIEEEFRRITTVPLESTFVRMLDEYTPKLLELFKSKGGAVRTQMQSILEVLYGCNTIEDKRHCVIRGLITYLGESIEDLIKEFKDADDTMIREDLTQHVLTLFMVKDLHRDPEYGICIEGAEVLAGIPSFTQACTLLMGLIYGLNLSYPKELKYTFEVFQKIFLELSPLKTSPKVVTLKTRLLS